LFHLRAEGTAAETHTCRKRDEEPFQSVLLCVIVRRGSLARLPLRALNIQGQRQIFNRVLGAVRDFHCETSAFRFSWVKQEPEPTEEGGTQDNENRQHHQVDIKP
jgi:hypothetical protein